VNWVLLVLAILADHLVTEIGIRRHGSEIEGNPLFRWSWRRYGGVASLLLQAAILLPLMWLAERFFPDEAVLLPAMLWLTVILNIGVLSVRR
jgi:hypothetical protein